MMVVTFVSVTNNLNVGMDYANGKTLTFHVTQKTDNGENNPKDFISTGENASIKEVAETMKKRLEAEVKVREAISAKVAAKQAAAAEAEAAAAAEKAAEEAADAEATEAPAEATETPAE